MHSNLAALYRPQRFEDVVEQDAIKKVLINQIKNNNLKHSYLFCGGAGTGKTTNARIIANMMNNYEVAPTELDCATHNSVDDMRAIVDSCATRPLQGKYKVFILDECHSISVAGWNAMLKILEEPPEYVIFLFCTTDPQKIIGTIMSRVQRFNFQRISVNGIVGRLKYILAQENITTYTEDALNYIARISKGGMRDSITTLEKCLDYDMNLTLENVLKVTSGSVSEDELKQFTELLLNKDCNNALIKINQIYMAGTDMSLFIKLYYEFLTNCSKYLITKNNELTTLTSTTINWLEQYTQDIDKFSTILFKFMEMKDKYSNSDLKLTLESWIIYICKWNF